VHEQRALRTRDNPRPRARWSTAPTLADQKSRVRARRAACADGQQALRL